MNFQAAAKPKKKGKGYAIKVERDHDFGEAPGAYEDNDYDDFM